MAQMTAMGKIKAHKSVMGFHDGLVDLEVGRTSTQALNIDTPFLGIQTVGLESTSLASQFD